MELTIRVAGPDDFPDVLLPVWTAFAEYGMDAERLDDQRLHFDDYRLLVAFDGDEPIGDLGDYPFDLTLPGGAAVPVAGVTMAGVLTTHRRRGVLRALMTRLLDDTVDRGWPAAILLASESSIYDRFGFGVAAQYTEVHVDPREADLLHEPRVAGRLRLVPDAAEAIALAASVWEGYRTSRAGLTTRRPWTWEMRRRDREKDRDGASGWLWVFHLDPAGVADGYACYRSKWDESYGVPTGLARVEEIVAADPEVEAELFRYLCSIDLVRRVELACRPVDDPLRWRLRDARQLVVDHIGDLLWLRPLDVAVVLSARCYATEDRFTLAVRDDLRPASGGRFALETSATGGRCVCTGSSTDAGDGPADLELDQAALGSLVLGTVAPSTLAAAGRLRAAPDVLRRADACWSSGPAPFAATEF